MLHQLGRFDRQRHRHILRRVKLRPIPLGDKIGDDLAQFGDGVCWRRRQMQDRNGVTSDSSSTGDVLSQKPGSVALPRRMAAIMVSPAVAVGQMGHDFQHQQVGPIHHVPGAAIAERADQLFEHVHVQLHRPLGGNAGLGQQAGERRHFVGQVAGPHDDVRPEHLAVVSHKAIGKIAFCRVRIAD